MIGKASWHQIFINILEQTFQNIVNKCFMYTIYQTFHDECLEKHFQYILHFFSYFVNVLKTFPVKLSYLSYFITV